MTDVVMPQMGESIVEGTLTKWLKKPGDHVDRDEPLFEISTDKVDTEIPSPAAGTLSEVLVEEGKTVGINTVVARIAEGDGAGPQAVAPPPQQPAAPTPEPAAQETIQPTPAPQQVEDTTPAEPTGPLSPLVRKMARENNIDLGRVKGTGAGGRITKQDLEGRLAQQRAAQPAPAAAPPAKQAEPAAPAAPPAPAVQAPAVSIPTGPRTRIEPMSAMRAKIAEHMALSQRTSAHVTTIHRVDMTKVARMREGHKADFQARYGVSLTYLPFVTRAAVMALRDFPLVNASVDGNNIVYHNDINIGIAVALENGLIVPVIRGADEKNVLGLQRSIVDLATRARSRQLKPEEVQGGTFSITNFGSFGSLVGTPIINQPQVAILGVGTVDKTPVVIDDAIGIRSICHLSLTFDHRLIDGALADQFMTRVKQALEGWSEEVL
ncbi:MAG: 2-oxoglutarate dehydrogenase, E2 component, dihydrolipoamide succinyltransferase [Acidobacteriia bacterium]|nr:2-oxoglutarate dehydrogenase, E2 component, dihydrolipoamide succinyltransferase [Terriglobia bacterium]